MQRNNSPRDPSQIRTCGFNSDLFATRATWADFGTVGFGLVTQFTY